MKKFVILTTQRTGSTLLWRYLGGHPNISSHGEMFLNSMTREDSYAFFRRANLKNRIKSYIDSAGALDDYFGELFNKTDDIEAVGFKLMYNQIFYGLEQWIHKNDIYIIHLIRTNLLKMVISRETAKKRGVYHAKPGEVVEQVRVSLNPETIINDLLEIEKEVEKFRSLYKEKKYMELFYENFVQNMDIETEKILNFLNLPLKNIDKIPLKKINPDSISDIVSNYNEIEKAIAGSDFERFLE